MSIKTYVVSSNIGESSSMKVDDKEILATLSSKDSFAFELQEIFESITQSITPVIKENSELVIELSGSVDLKIDGGVKYLFFNTALETKSSNSMKVILKTSIKAENRS